MLTDLPELSTLLCDRILWDLPELQSLRAVREQGDDVATAKAFVAHLRARRMPNLGVSPEFVARLRAGATPEQVEKAREGIQRAIDTDPVKGHGISLSGEEKIVLGATPELCEAMAEYAVAARPKWPHGNWGATNGICSFLKAAWPLAEFADAHAVPFLCWLTEQIEAEWEWARTWGEGMLGSSGHNWWLHTFMGFWMAGTFFPELRGLAQFRALAPDYLEREMRLLMEEDGFTKERSGYHWGTVNHFVRFARMAEQNDVVLSDDFRRRLRRTAATVWETLTPDGNAPRFGDTGHYTGRTSLGNLRVLAAKFDLPEGKFVAEALDPDWTPPYADMLTSCGEDLLPAYRRLVPAQPPLDTALERSGYYFLRSAWEPDADWLCIDAGARGTTVSSHDHTAVFHLELHGRGRPLLIDNCSGPYGGSPERLYRESSAAHNVATVDGEDHIPIVNEWRWEHPVLPFINDWITTPRYAYFNGTHEGYYRLEKPVHAARRKVFYLRGEYWVLIDRFTAAAPEDEHEYAIHFHVGPESELDERGRLVTRGEGGNLAIVPLDPAGWQASKEANPFPAENYANPDHVSYTRCTSGSDVFVAVLAPFDGEDVPEIELSALEVEADGRALDPFEATGLSIRVGGREDVYFDQHMQWNLPWRIGEHMGTGRLYHSRCR